MKIHKSFLPILALSSAALLQAQEAPAADPYVKDAPATNIDPQPAERSNISVCYETFSVPLSLAAKLQRERKPDAELYARLTAPAGKDGIRQESLDMVRSLSSARAELNSITEEIYPTEFEPPELPNTVGVAIDPTATTPSAPASNLSKGNPSADYPEGLSTPGTPTSFDTRNTGRSLLIEATSGDNPAWPFVELSLSPDIVTLAGRESWGQGASRSEMPVFETQRFTTSLTVRVNQPTLVGTINRPPGSQVDPDSAKRVWFAFVTVKAVKP